jgi:hypothetical protein
MRIAWVSMMALVLLASGQDALGAEGDLEARIASLESSIEHQRRELERQRSDIEELGGIMAYVSLLFGTVFALWAQNRDRSALGWFFCGVIPVLNVVAAFVLLHLNRVHIEAGRQRGP